MPKAPKTRKHRHTSKCSVSRGCFPYVDAPAPLPGYVSKDHMPYPSQSAPGAYTRPVGR